VTQARYASPALALVSVALAACNSLPTQSDQPALIERATADSQAELRQVIEAALGRADFQLAPDALTRSTILALEQGGGAPDAARGRLLDMPERFELVINGGRCFLIRTGTGERFELERTDCVAAAP